VWRNPRLCTALVAKRLHEAGFLHGDALTVSGKSTGEEAKAAIKTPHQEVVRPLSQPINPTGGLVILRGDLAPEGCVVKVAGHELVYRRDGARLQRPGKIHGFANKPLTT